MIVRIDYISKCMVVMRQENNLDRHKMFKRYKDCLVDLTENSLSLFIYNKYCRY